MEPYVKHTINDITYVSELTQLLSVKNNNATVLIRANNLRRTHVLRKLCAH